MLPNDPYVSLFKSVNGYKKAFFDDTDFILDYFKLSWAELLFEISLLFFIADSACIF